MRYFLFLQYVLRHLRVRNRDEGVQLRFILDLVACALCQADAAGAHIQTQRGDGFAIFHCSSPFRRNFLGPPSESCCTCLAVSFCTLPASAPGSWPALVAVLQPGSDPANSANRWL